VNADSRDVPVRMIRADLENVPPVSVPDGFALKWYVPGDEKDWLRIHRDAEKFLQVTEETFRTEFGNDAALPAQRQCYLADNCGKAVGTASAWFTDDCNGERYGRVHWIAVLPGYQGRRLSLPLLSAVCLRLRELGHGNAWLETSTARISAINLYLKFGFVPDIRRESDADAWSAVRNRTRYPCG
jgi:GNAT superfamily N-acetyltransferase